MNFKQWKLGLFIALLLGFFTACGAAAVLDVVFNWKFVFFFLSLVGKDVLLFCKSHPSNIVSFGDTAFYTKQDFPARTPQNTQPVTPDPK